MSKAYSELLNLVGDVHLFNPASVARGLIRMAEDVADEGRIGTARSIYYYVCDYLYENKCWMQLAKLRGDGNKMIGVEGDERMRLKYLKNLIDEEKGA